MNTRVTTSFSSGPSSLRPDETLNNVEASGGLGRDGLRSPIGDGPSSTASHQTEHVLAGCIGVPTAQ